MIKKKKKGGEHSKNKELCRPWDGSKVAFAPCCWIWHIAQVHDLKGEMVCLFSLECKDQEKALAVTLVSPPRSIRVSKS